MTDKEKVDKICEEVALENGLDPKYGRELFTKLQKSIRYFMILERVPKIILRNFGTFEPNSILIEKHIKSQKELQNVDEEEIKKLEEIKDRITGDKTSRRHLSRKSEKLQGPIDRGK